MALTDSINQLTVLRRTIGLNIWEESHIVIFMSIELCSSQSQ